MTHKNKRKLSKKTARKGGRLGKNLQYLDQRHATGLMRSVNDVTAFRMWKCNWVAFEPNVVLSSSDLERSSRLSGLVTCRNVWFCPICSAKISWKRMLEVNVLLHWARENGYIVQMLTLTARHKLSDKLARQVEGLKRAKERLRQRREWRALRHEILGTITATEVTFGANGWHTHFHEIVVSRCRVDLDALRPVWLACLKGFGINGNERALQVQDATAAREYLTKFGAAEEMTLDQSKRGRKESRTPWQLLRDSREGDKKASALWVEFAKAFKGRRQLVWSNGLKKKANVKEQTDEQAVKEIAESNFQPVREWPSEVWPLLRSRRGNLLDAAADGLDIDLVEVGPTDEETACDERDNSFVVEGAV